MGRIRLWPAAAVALAWFMFAPTAPAQQPGCGPSFRDDFNGTALDPGWSVVRPDQSLQVSGGTLKIPTGPGTLLAGTNTAANLVLRPAPGGAWTVVAKLSHHGLVAYQKAGILVYGDDDDYTSVGRSATPDGERFWHTEERAATVPSADPSFSPLLPANYPDDFYVRLGWNGAGSLVSSYSTDATNWTSVGRTTNWLPDNPRVGVFAYADGAATAVTPEFDWIEVDPVCDPPPGTLSLTLGPAGDLGTLLPSIARDYTMSFTATASASAAQSVLTVVDPSPTAPGHLVNGAAALAQPLQMTAADATHQTGAFAAVSATPLTLLSFATPLNQDAITIQVKQSVATTDALTRGSYGKTLTFTLTAVQP